jgi:hypothetical protein
MDNTVTVLSMNVRGLFSSVKKRNDVFDWAKREKYLNCLFSRNP